PLGDLTDEDLAGLAEGHHRGRCTRTFGVGDNGGLTALKDSDHGVRGAQVNTNRSCHAFSFTLSSRSQPALVESSTLKSGNFKTVVKSRRSNLSLLSSTFEEGGLFPTPGADIRYLRGAV